MPHPIIPVPPKPCRACGTMMSRKRINGRMEDRAVFKRRVYCDRMCMARGQTKPASELTRSGLLVRARQHLERRCGACATTERLSIHHRNGNWRDNSPGNLATLCASCHSSHHHSRGEIVRRRTPRVCPACGISFLRRDGRTMHCSRSCAWVTRKRPFATAPIDSAPSGTPSSPPREPPPSSNSGTDSTE